MTRRLQVRLVVIAVAVALVCVPYALSQEASAEGKALYDKKCAMCHGKDGVAKSMAKGSANLNDAAWQEATSVDDIVTVITAGKGKMKGLEGKLEPDQIKAVATYVKQMK